MLSTSLPSKFPFPFAGAAAAGDIRPIPEASQISITPGAASLSDGFPPLNFVPVGSGGVPPFGQDMNGILNQITAWIQWQNAQGPVTYDATFSAAIGGYPKGALLPSAAGGSWWLSTVENNTTNPDTGGVGWLYLSYGLAYAGNPNGNIAGVAATSGALSSSLLWDSVHSVLWVCTTTGTASTAVWTSSAPLMESYWCGTSTGSGNAQILTVPMLAFPAGTGISWRVGASQTNSGATSVTVGAFGTFPVRKDSPTGPIALTGGELVAGNIISGRFDGTNVQLTATALGTAALANASSNTGTVAAVVSGTGITPGHLATFSDALGTIEDGGPVTVYNSPTYINTSQTVGPGAYLVDTSAGAITLTLGSTLTGSYIFIDAQNTWGANNLTINGNGNNIGNNSTNVAATFLANVSDYQFTIEASSTYWRLV